MIREKIVNVIRWLRDFFFEKFNSRNEDLPYYVTIVISAVLFIVAMNGFVELTDDLGDNELRSVDESVTTYITSFRKPWLTDYLVFVTHLGDRNAYIVFTVLLALYYFIKNRSWKFIVQTTLVLILATLSNIVLKRVINRARPTLEHLVTVNSLSYPSGHAMSAMAFYGFLIYLCLRYRMRQWIRYVLVVSLVLLIVSIGISRIYLGVHYPTDVAAGFIGGLLWVTFCAIVFTIIDLLRRRQKGEPSM